MKSAAERPRRDRGDIVHEPLGGDLGELGRHVAADRNEMLARHGERRVEHPVAMRVLLEKLLAGRRGDRADGVVRATKRDGRAIGRPAHAIHRVVSHRQRQLQFALLDLPNLNLTHACRLPTRHREPFAIRRKAHRLDALGETNEARDNPRAIGLVQQNFMEPGDGEELSIRRIIQRRDHRRQRVNGQMILIVALAGIGRGVIARAFGHPLFDERDLVLGQRRFALGHLDLAGLVRDQLPDEETFLRLADAHGRGLVLAVTARQQLGKVGHHITALRLRGLMAALTLSLKDGADFLVVTDGAFVFLRLGGGSGGAGQRRNCQPKGQSNSERNAIHKCFISPAPFRRTVKRPWSQACWSRCE